MGTDKNYGTIATKTGTAVLTAAYGDESAGWTTKGIDVSMVDVVSFEVTYTKKNAANTLLSLQVLKGERTAADLDAYYPLMELDPTDTTNYTLLREAENTVDVDGQTIDQAYVFELPPLDVRGLSMIRLAAKIDDATGSPTLSVRYLRSGDGLPAVTAPAVS